MAIPIYPTSLPPGLKAGTAYRRESPNLRSKMASGRYIQRRARPDAPWFVRKQWLFTDGEAQAFMAWCRDVLEDCNRFFQFPVRSPLGFNYHLVRIVDHYEPPEHAGPGLWTITAELEFDKEPLAPVGDGEFPDELAGSEIFDITMNRIWHANG